MSRSNFEDGGSGKPNNALGVDFLHRLLQQNSVKSSWNISMKDATWYGSQA
jgi:hypothetical protein